MAFSSPDVPRINFFQQNGSPSLNQKINAGAPTTTNSRSSDIPVRVPLRLPEWSSCFKAAGLQPEWVRAMENQAAVRPPQPASGEADHSQQRAQPVGTGHHAQHAATVQSRDEQLEQDHWDEPGAHRDSRVMSPARDSFKDSLTTQNVAALQISPAGKQRPSPISVNCPQEPSESTSTRSFSSIDAYMRTVHKVPFDAHACSHHPVCDSLVLGSSINRESLHASICGGPCASDTEKSRFNAEMLYMHIHTHTYCICIHTHTYILYMHIYMHIHIVYAYTHTHTHTHTLIVYAYTHTHIHTYILYAYTHTYYACINIHTRTHTHTHSCTCMHT
jgi:hypothetical protein